MCGTGRFLIPMLEANLDIEGFDASTDMLEALQRKYSTIIKYLTCPLCQGSCRLVEI